MVISWRHGWSIHVRPSMSPAIESSTHVSSPTLSLSRLIMSVCTLASLSNNCSLNSAKSTSIKFSAVSVGETLHIEELLGHEGLLVTQKLQEHKDKPLPRASSFCTSWSS